MYFVYFLFGMKENYLPASKQATIALRMYPDLFFGWGQIVIVSLFFDT